MRKFLVLTVVPLMFFLMGAPRSVSAYDSRQGVHIHGFVSQGYLYSEEYNFLTQNSKDGSFEYNEMGINFSNQLTDKLRVGIQLFSRDLGDVANNKITLDWAYGDYRLANWLGLRAGRIKLPLGFYNETRDVDMLRTSIVMPQGIYSDMLRDNWIAVNGAGLYGVINIGPVGLLDYQVISGTIWVDPDNGGEKYIKSNYLRYGEGEVVGQVESSNSYCAALRWETPLDGLRAGGAWLDGSFEIPFALNLQLGTNTIQVDLPLLSRRFVQIYSVEYTWHDLIISAEYSQERTENEAAGEIVIIDAETYYLSASYRFTDLFTMGVYYAEYYRDMEDKEGEDENFFPYDHMAWEKDLALTLRFDIAENLIFKLEGHTVNGTANILAIDNTSNDYDEEDWYYGAAKVTVGF